jgi:hypothetical protein
MMETVRQPELYSTALYQHEIAVIQEANSYIWNYLNQLADDAAMPIEEGLIP